MKILTLATIISSSAFGMTGFSECFQNDSNNNGLIPLCKQDNANSLTSQKELTQPKFLLEDSELKRSLGKWFSENELWKLVQGKTTVTLNKSATNQEKEKVLYDKLFLFYSRVALSNLVNLRIKQFWSSPEDPNNFLNLDRKGLIPTPTYRNPLNHSKKNHHEMTQALVPMSIPNHLEINPRHFSQKRAIQNEALIPQNAEKKQKKNDESSDLQNENEKEALTSQNSIITHNYDKRSDSWKKLFDLPDYLSEEEKTKFFEAAEKQFGIPSEKAQQIMSEWRIVEREIYASEKKLSNKKLLKWRYSQTDITREDPVFQNILEKVRKSRKEFCRNYKEYEESNVENLIFYHDFMQVRLDTTCSVFYQKGRCCNNDSQLSSNIRNWLRNNNLYITLIDFVADLISDNYEENTGILSEYYSKSLDYIFDTKTIIKSWFDLSDRKRRHFTNKVNNLGNDIDFGNLTTAKKEVLDLNTVVNLIRKPNTTIVLGDNYASVDLHKQYASIWKILIQKDFQKPRWCKNLRKGKKVVLKRFDEKSSLCYLNQLLGERNHLEHLDYTQAESKSILSFWQYKKDSQNSGNESALRKEIADYFGVTESAVEKIVDSGKPTEPVNIQDLVNRQIEKYNQLLENNKIVFYKDRINAFKNELRHEFVKIINYLRYVIGLNSKKICELLRLDPNFNINSLNSRNKPIEVIEILSDSSSDDESFRKKNLRKNNMTQE